MQVACGRKHFKWRLRQTENVKTLLLAIFVRDYAVHLFHHSFGAADLGVTKGCHEDRMTQCPDGFFMKSIMSLSLDRAVSF